MNYLGLDTETIQGYCRLLCLSDGRIFKINSVEEVLAFMKSWKSQDFVAFNADYDIQSILKYFPHGVIDDLLKTIPVEWEGMHLLYVQDKYLRWDDCTIFDCYQFYQMGLDRAAKKYLGEGKLDVDASKITEKNIYSPKMIEYCIRDADLCLRLFETFRGALPDPVKDVPPVSNAFYSGKYFGKELRENRNSPISVNRAFREVYFGARNEIFERGYYPEGLYYYDISAAYPFEIAKLSDLKKPFVKYNCNYEGNASFSIYDVKVLIDDKYVSPLLMKSKGLSIYPVGCYEGKITKPEYERIRKYPHLIRHATHVFGGNKYPFKEKVEALWELRQSVKNPLPVKVIMNSLYGKMAAAIPKYKTSSCRLDGCLDVYWCRDGRVYYLVEDIFQSNFVYASHITAQVRCRMYDLISQFPGSIVAVQTDSVMSKDPLPLVLDGNLGEWKCEKWDEAIVLGSGVYFYRIGDQWEGKFRGFSFPKDKLPKVMHDLLNAKNTQVEFPSKKRVSLQESRRIEDDTLANVIMQVTKKLDINFDKKRVWDSTWSSGRQIREKRIGSIAHVLYRPQLQREFDFPA